MSITEIQLILMRSIKSYFSQKETWLSKGYSVIISQRSSKSSEAKHSFFEKGMLIRYWELGRHNAIEIQLLYLTLGIWLNDSEDL